MMLGGISDRAGRERNVVAAFQHRRQRHQADHDHGCADDARGRGHDRAHEDDRKCKRARHAPQQDLQALQQVGGDAGLLEHGPHEDEHRDGDEHEILGDAAEHPRREVGQRADGNQVEGGAEQPEPKRRPT
jgi:hypothetical protein